MATSQGSPSSYPTAPVVAAALVGGYAVGRATKARALAGVVLAAGGVVAGRQWLRTSGAPTTATLTGVFVASFGLSHPLAKRIGAWPAVLTAGAVAAGAAYALNDRKA